jgi:hypothetical protein
MQHQKELPVHWVGTHTYRGSEPWRTVGWFDLISMIEETYKGLYTDT